MMIDKLAKSPISQMVLDNLPSYQDLAVPEDTRNLADGPIARFIINQLSMKKIAQHSFIGTRTSWKNNVALPSASFQDVDVTVAGYQLTFGTHSHSQNSHDDDQPLSCHVQAGDIVVREDIHNHQDAVPRQITVSVHNQGEIPVSREAIAVGEPMRRLVDLPLLLDRVIGWRTIQDFGPTIGGTISFTIDTSHWDADADPAMAAGMLIR